MGLSKIDKIKYELNNAIQEIGAWEERKRSAYQRMTQARSEYEEAEQRILLLMDEKEMQLRKLRAIHDDLA